MLEEILTSMKVYLSISKSGELLLSVEALDYEIIEKFNLDPEIDDLLSTIGDGYGIEESEKIRDRFRDVVATLDSRIARLKADPDAWHEWAT